MFKFMSKKERQEKENLKLLSQYKIESEENPTDINALKKAVEAYSVCCNDVCAKMDQLTSIRF